MVLFMCMTMIDKIASKLDHDAYDIYDIFIALIIVYVMYL